MVMQKGFRRMHVFVRDHFTTIQHPSNVTLMEHRSMAQAYR
jgi:hypothetical protein